MKSFYYALTFTFLLSLALAKPVAAGNDSNIFKSGVSYVWLSENDSQGLMFNSKFGHYLGKRFALGVDFSALSASRYDDLMAIYTIKNTFLTGTLDASYDLVNNNFMALRFGGGPSVRHRAEINSNSEDEGTTDGSVKHIKTSDVGGMAYFENDFGFAKNGMIGGRIGYQYFTKGSPVLSVGLHVGFTF